MAEIGHSLSPVAVYHRFLYRSGASSRKPGDTTVGGLYPSAAGHRTLGLKLLTVVPCIFNATIQYRDILWIKEYVNLQLQLQHWNE